MAKKSEALKRLDIITLFPGMFEGPMTESLLGRARDRGIVDVQLHPLRDYSAKDNHKTVDHRPYGGGAGMVLQAQPFFDALTAVKAQGRKALGRSRKPWVVFMSPQGAPLDQKKAAVFAVRPWVVLLCGHYEGIDERLMKYVDEEVSIGDYVLTGGELPAMVLADTVLRLIPGVVKEVGSIQEDSFQQGLLDHPHYTRPALWKGQHVPAVLLSGNHADIKSWRAEQSRLATKKKRPDLLSRSSKEKHDESKH